jgi:dihydrolipoamide dehydrogenase
MGTIEEVKVPDIGDFHDVAVIEVMVAVGDQVKAEDPLITLESDKATLDVPSPAAGVVREMQVKAGDRVSEGSLILLLETAAAAEQPGNTDVTAVAVEVPPRSGPEPAIVSEVPPLEAEVVVLGAGPGGYTAAFRAADLGQKTILVERYPTLGGVCLNVGCIPSKAYLGTAHIISETREMAGRGVVFGEPTVDAGKLVAWKDQVVSRLTRGLAGLAKQREVQVVQGIGEFRSPHLLAVETATGPVTIRFARAIIAAGSQPVRIPGFPYNDPRIWDSTAALNMEVIPQRLLVIGGGIIGLEMAAVFAALGTRITVVEMLPELLAGCDRDLVRPLQKRIARRYENIFLETRVTSIESLPEGLRVSFESKQTPPAQVFDRVLVAVGREPNGKRIGAETAGVQVDEKGFIPVDGQQRTNVPHIFAVGDIAGQPMLAHKAVHQGKVAAEVAAGLKSGFESRAIPAVAYTDPEVAWMGLGEADARAQGIEFEKGIFPWAASGRALGMGREEGLTKLLFDRQTRRILGAGIVGVHAGDLLAEAILALEMGADAQDLSLTIHPHPTLSETLAFAAEMVEGTITDLLPSKR